MVQGKYTALIIGCGNMGALNDAPGSGNEEKTISYAKALKENGNFEVYYRDLYYWRVEDSISHWGGFFDTEESYDVVIVATPDNDHYLRLVDALEYRPKLVICEKPLCNDVVEAKAIIKRYEEAGTPILCDYTRRFIPEFIWVKDQKPKYGECHFNRGWLHSATHAIDFFEMIGLTNYKIKEIQSEDRIWNLWVDIGVGTFKDTRIGNMPVCSAFDYHTRYVIDNAYNFLEGKEELLCTMYDGLKALEIMERLCK